MLSLAQDLQLPMRAVTEKFAFLGRTGSGKTYAATKLCELMLQSGAQVVALDHVGVWYGLRLAANGKGKGLAIPVFGGLNGDLPLTPTSGALIADLVVDRQLSLVLDVSMFRKAQRQQFVTDFAEQLFHRKKEHRSPVHLFLEEAQAYVPQFFKGSERMLGAFEDLVKIGRNYGIGASLISQRPQAINKDVLNQVECLLAFQTTGLQERKAIEAWISEKGLDQNIAAELPGLGTGQAWLWSPAWLRTSRIITVAKKETFNASATPEVGQEVVTPKTLSPVDVEEIRTAMEQVIEQAAENDPAKWRYQARQLESRVAALTGQVEQLQGQLAQAQQARQEAEQATVRKVPVISQEKLERLESIVKHTGANVQTVLERATLDIRTVRDEICEAVSQLGAVAKAHHTDPLHTHSLHKGSTAKAVPPKVVLPKVVPPKATPHQATSSRPPADAQTSDRKVNGPQQRILNTLASFEALGITDVARSNIAVFSDASPSSSAFSNNLGALRTAGLIDYPQGGYVALTVEGREYAESPQPIQSVEELHQAWCEKLSGPQGRILSVLTQVYPDSIDRQQLAELVEASATSSAFSNNLGAMRSLGLLDYPNKGYVVATALLFPPGLT